jgi:hypothetical protein
MVTGSSRGAMNTAYSAVISGERWRFLKGDLHPIAPSPWKIPYKWRFIAGKIIYK